MLGFLILLIKKKKIVIIFQKKMEILLHFYAFNHFYSEKPSKGAK
jgi:hypothetical protein